MNTSQQSSRAEGPSPAAGTTRGRAPAWIVLFPILATLAGGLLFFWPKLVSGRSLQPIEIQERIAELSLPSEGPGVDLERIRLAAEAIEQLARRSRAGERAFVDLCGLLPANAGHADPRVRRAVARAMGEAAWHEGYPKALARMLTDADTLVQRLAAESLAAWERMEGREILLRNLEPLAVESPFAGRLVAGAEQGMRVNRTGQLAFIETAEQGRKQVFAPITGYVESILPSGTAVTEGQKLAVLLPDKDQVWYALRGLYLVGQKQDVERIRAALDQRQGLGRDVYRQKSETIEMIEERARRGISVGRVEKDG